jgi:HJR/Mrr/RecB family endonuclease
VGGINVELEIGEVGLVQYSEDDTVVVRSLVYVREQTQFYFIFDDGIDDLVLDLKDVAHIQESKIEITEGNQDYPYLLHFSHADLYFSVFCFEEQAGLIKNIIDEYVESCTEDFWLSVDIDTSLLRADKAAQLILWNFIEKTDERFYLYQDVILRFEALLYNNNNLNHLEGDVEYFFDHVFYKLVKLLHNKLYLNAIETSYFAVWNALREQSIVYFASQFENQHGSFYQPLKKLNLEQCLDIYCRTDTLDVKAEANIAKFASYLIHNEKVNGSKDFLDVFSFVEIEVYKIMERNELIAFEKYIMSDSTNKITIEDVDLMTGEEFEHFIASYFQGQGYETSLTRRSGDQGIDVIMMKNMQRVGIQAKRYSNKVTNSAIQQAVGGLRLYALDKGMVITSSYFTDSAKELAKANDILLWDRDDIKDKLLRL